MRFLINRPLKCFALVLAAGTLALTAGASASTLTIYKNDLTSAADRAQIKQIPPNATCQRGGSAKAFRFKLGKGAKECFYRVPMVGKNMQVTGTGRIFKSTPAKVLKRSYLGVSLRQAKDGSRYQFVVWPATRRFGLRKVMPNGQIINLGSRKVGKRINPPGKANRLTLRAFNGGHGRAQLIGSVNGNRVVSVQDEEGNDLAGEDTSFSIGSKNAANGAIGSFVKIRVAIPDPL